MYLGKVVELSPSDELYARPVHPYTEALLSAIPIPDAGARGRRRRIVLRGDVPSPIAPPAALPLPHALPLRDGGLRHDRAARSSPTATATSPPATTRWALPPPKRPSPRSSVCRGGAPEQSCVRRIPGGGDPGRRSSDLRPRPGRSRCSSASPGSLSATAYSSSPAGSHSRSSAGTRRSACRAAGSSSSRCPATRPTRRTSGPAHLRQRRAGPERRRLPLEGRRDQGAGARGRDREVAREHPGMRVSSYFSTGSPAYVSNDRHTTFAEFYPPGEEGFNADDGLGHVRDALQAAAPPACRCTSPAATRSTTPRAREPREGRASSPRR